LHYLQESVGSSTDDLMGACVCWAQARLGFNVTIVSFEHVELREQVGSVLGANYFIAMHGAGMANTFWLNPGATVVVSPFPPPVCAPVYAPSSQCCVSPSTARLEHPAPHAVFFPSLLGSA
jgi:hypothetical protein